MNRARAFARGAGEESRRQADLEAGASNGGSRDGHGSAVGCGDGMDESQAEA